MSYRLDRLKEISPGDRGRFEADGFLVVERLLEPEHIQNLRSRFPLLFAGKFDTGVYPDEWYWREGMSLPDVTRHMANEWKADLTVAKLALSESIGRFAADLCGWSGARLGQDTIWWKAPKTKPIAYHQDTSFMDFLEPSSTLTCWVTLDDTHRDAGTLEYAPGSQKWPLTRLPSTFHGEEDYRAQMEAAAKAAGVKPPSPFFIEVPPAPAFSIAAKRGTARPPISPATECGVRSVSTCCPRTFSSAIVPAATFIAAINAPTIWCLMKAIFRWSGHAPGAARNGLKLIARAACVTRREGNRAMAMRATHYAKSGDVHVAYQVFGSGPIDLVLAPGFVSQIENYWDQPDLARWLLRLGNFARVIMFDKRGTGLSDPVSEVPSLELRMDDVRAVMDAVGTERAAQLGISEGGPLATLFAATYPQRCRGLVLYGSFARSSWITPEGLEAYLRYVERAWGSGGSLPMWAPSRRNDPALQQWWGRFERLGASPAAAIALVRMIDKIDISDILSSIHVPTLVIHCTGDTLINVEHGRVLAEHIPGARLLELPGDDHLFFLHDQIGDAIEEFLTGSISPAENQRVLATVLFTDIVGSTARAEELGDQRWQNLLDAHHTTVRRQLARYRGNEVKSLGDGFLATFDGPARAVRCACAIAEAVGPLRIQVRSGLHTGEIELVDNDVKGIAVHIASRVSALAEPGEVLVSRTVKDLVAGSGLSFNKRGKHSLKGLQEPMDLYAASN
jgi:class 3 adenylate cyclase/alpha-beta hydrolase superfamily lysophospholipase